MNPVRLQRITNIYLSVEVSTEIQPLTKVRKLSGV